jgi:hypothetical protein
MRDARYTDGAELQLRTRNQNGRMPADIARLLIVRILRDAHAFGFREADARTQAAIGGS